MKVTMKANGKTKSYSTGDAKAPFAKNDKRSNITAFHDNDSKHKYTKSSGFILKGSPSPKTVTEDDTEKEVITTSNATPAQTVVEEVNTNPNTINKNDPSLMLGDNRYTGFLELYNMLKAKTVIIDGRDITMDKIYRPTKISDTVISTAFPSLNAFEEFMTSDDESFKFVEYLIEFIDEYVKLNSVSSTKNNFIIYRCHYNPMMHYVQELIDLFMIKHYRKDNYKLMDIKGYGEYLLKKDTIPLTMLKNKIPSVTIMTGSGGIILTMIDNPINDIKDISTPHQYYMEKHNTDEETKEEEDSSNIDVEDNNDEEKEPENDKGE